MSNAHLTTHYRQMVNEYKTLSEELAAVQAEELRARQRTWEQSSEKSAAGITTEGDMTTTDFRIDVIELRSRLRSLEVEIQWCRDMMQYESESVNAR